MVPTALLPLILTWTVFSPGESIRVVPACDQDMFKLNVDKCRSDFNQSMEHRGYQEQCPWPQVKRIYNRLSVCVEECIKASWCMGHTFLVDDVFLEVHQLYFSLCGRVQDPPLLTLIMFIAPGIVATLFFPFLCLHLTTWDT